MSGGWTPFGAPLALGWRGLRGALCLLAKRVALSWVNGLVNFFWVTSRGLTPLIGSHRAHAQFGFSPAFDGVEIGTGHPFYPQGLFLIQ